MQARDAAFSREQILDAFFDSICGVLFLRENGTYGFERAMLEVEHSAKRTEDQLRAASEAVAEPDLPEGVLWALESPDFMEMVNEVSLASRGLPEHLSDAEREAKKCDCGYPEKPCLRIMLRNGPPFPSRPCEPVKP